MLAAALQWCNGDIKNLGKKLKFKFPAIYETYLIFFLSKSFCRGEAFSLSSTLVSKGNQMKRPALIAQVFVAGQIHIR